MAVFLPGYTWITNPRNGGGTYATDGPSSILLHMTVSMGISASYIARHPYPPHLWANPYNGDRFQTVSLDRSAFALYQPDYGNSWTNKKGFTLQTELVGVPVVSRATYTDDQCRWIGEQVVAPQAVWLASTGRPVDLTQVRYHADTGGSASESWSGRMSESEWDSFNGLVAHIDVPYNDHWDCSAERLDRIAAYARAALGDTTPPPTEEPFTVSQYEDIISQLAALQSHLVGRTDWILKGIKKCRLIEVPDGLGWWLTDFIGVTPVPSPDAVVQLMQLGYLDNDADSSGNPVPQGCPRPLFDTLVRYDRTGGTGPPVIDVEASLQQATPEQLLSVLVAKLKAA